MPDEQEGNNNEAPEVPAEEVEIQPAAEVAAVAVRPPELSVAPTVDSADLVARLAAISRAQEAAMQRDVDYGIIPGTNKPALLKPGAEKLGVLFQLDIQLANEKRWGPGDHLTVLSRATVYHAPTGARLGYGEGLCTTRERKYGIRKMNRTCPECGTENILRSKYPPRDNPEAEKGWYCFAKRGGCGENFDAGDERITSQEEGEKENPDLPDTWNTVVKMAEKRARIDAVLAVTGASALFTQDIDEQQATEPEAVAVELPPWAEPAPEADRERCARAMAWLLGPNAEATWGKIKQRLGVEALPVGVAVALGIAIAERKSLDEGEEPQAPAEEPVQGEVVN